MGNKYSDHKRCFPTKNLVTYIKTNYVASEMDDIAHILGISTTAYARMLCRPLISWAYADKHAISLNTHPVNIWPDWYEETEKTVVNRKNLSKKVEKGRKTA